MKLKERGKGERKKEEKKKKIRVREGLKREGKKLTMRQKEPEKIKREWRRDL